MTNLCHILPEVDRVQIPFNGPLMQVKLLLYIINSRCHRPCELFVLLGISQSLLTCSHFNFLWQNC